MNQFPMERIPPISIFKERLFYIDYIFNSAIKINQYDSNSYQPLIKVAFLGKGDTFLDRIFTAEDGEFILTFVKNVLFDSDLNIYKRSSYMIMREALSYVHFDTGIIFKDIFEYAQIEKEEVKQILIFSYEDKLYEDISEISSNDQNYKTKTKILIKSNGTEIKNDMYIYNRLFGIYSQSKIGYYISDDNIKYFHVTMFYKDVFGAIRDQYAFFMPLLQNPDNVIPLINTIPDNIKSVIQNTETGRKKKQKKQPKDNYLGMSLVGQIASASNLQNKKIIVAWYLCEIMYPFFFRN